MGWGEIFFGFHGRISRRTYWIASLLVTLAGLLFNALLTYLATGNPLAPEVWQRPADKSPIWAPVWLAYFLFIAWPSAALAIKRLHDRERPSWIWYLYFAITLVFSLIPLRNAAGAEPDSAATAISVLTLTLAGYLFFELGVLRGTIGRNAHGDDPLPSDYYGGDYSFSSWLLAIEGRISRRKWWLGIFILTGLCLLAATALGLIAHQFILTHPEMEQNIANPEWVNTPEGAAILFQLGLRSILPLAVFLFAAWSSLALGIKRLHDRGLSSWLILVVVLPAFGVALAPTLAAQFDLGEGAVRLPLLLLLASVIWSILQFGIFKGTTGPNPYGPDPLAGSRR